MLRKLGWHTVTKSAADVLGAVNQLAYFTGITQLRSNASLVRNSTNGGLIISCSAQTVAQLILDDACTSNGNTQITWQRCSNNQFALYATNSTFPDFALFSYNKNSNVIYWPRNYIRTVNIGSIVLGGRLSPASFSTNQADYNPAGQVDNTFLRLNVTGACNLSGLLRDVDFPDGRLINITNIGNSLLTITHNDAASTSFYRFSLPNGANLPVHPGDSYWFWYDNSVSFWRLAGDGYVAMLLGRAGGQTLIGGTAASETLVLQSTSNATRGDITTDCADVTHVSGSKFRMAGQNRFRYLNSQARVYRTTAQTITTSTLTAVQFDNESYDTDAIHDNVTNNTRLTCKVAGKYAISGGLELESVGAGNFSLIRIKLNNTTIMAESRQGPSNSSEVLSVATQINMAVNDYIELIVFHTAGINRNTGSTDQLTHFEMAYIGE